MIKEQLEHIVQRIAKPNFRNAQNTTWQSAMNEMESLVSDVSNAYDVQEWSDQGEVNYKNFSVTFPGSSRKKIIIGAHYDTYSSTPGADDNASAVATLLALADRLKNIKLLSHTIEAVFYCCEEPPFFGTENMGSFKHAQAQSKDDIELMVSLEMVGYFSEETDSQNYPFPLLEHLYGDKANYLMLVSNLHSVFKMNDFFSNLDSRNNEYKRLSLPNILSGLDWSDHRNFWEKGIPAVMLTDTGMFRNPNYHEITDTYETLDYTRMEKLVYDLESWIYDYR